MFDIPNVKESKQRQLMLLYYPCPHCGYVRDITYPRFNRSGRCLDCSIPFTIVDHHAKGMCKRCHMKLLRHKPEGV
jgi:DNA-directed RNA polymerase subunit RPC12/RpoP